MTWATWVCTPLGVWVLLVGCASAPKLPTRDNLRTACESAKRSCEATAEACAWMEADAPTE